MDKTMQALSEFPSADEWQAIYAASPFPSLLALAGGSCEPLADSTESNIDTFARGVTLHRLALELHNRIVNLARSYVFMEYFHAQGIPDQRWYISLGRAGQSVEYFPDFQEHHFAIKGWFDYYADTFYQNLFASWAVVGHILNDIFRLEIKKRQVDFEPAVNGLAREQGDLASTLASVLEDSAFQRARQLRNDITHNEVPSSVGMTVSKSETEKARVYSMGMKSYVTSTEILENARGTVMLLRRTLKALRTRAT